jgi:hypothetical protein
MGLDYDANLANRFPLTNSWLNGVLGGRIWLEEVGHWGRASEVYMLFLALS